MDGIDKSFFSSVLKKRKSEIRHIWDSSQILETHISIILKSQNYRDTFKVTWTSFNCEVLPLQLYLFFIYVNRYAVCKRFTKYLNEYIFQNKI